MKILVAILPPACLAAAFAVVGPRERPEAPVVLDRRVADFREDEEPSRVVAALEATLVREGDRTVLRISASAVGPRVDPPPGVRGVRGGNAITAEEIAAIVAGGRAQVRVRGKAAGTVAAGRRGAVLERRLSPDGRVDHVPAAGTRTVEGLFEAPIEGEGAFDVEVVVDGRVRVRADVRVDGRGARIAHLESVGHGAHP